MTGSFGQNPLGIFSIPFLGEFVAVFDVKVVAIDLDILADYKMFGFVDIALGSLVGTSFQEFSS